MKFRTIETGKPVILLSLLAAVLAQTVFGQIQATAPDLAPDVAQAAVQTPPPPPQAAPAQIPASPAAPPAAPAATAAPDYPYTRGLTLGAFYFATQAYRAGDLVTGHQATEYESVYNLGKGKGTYGFEGSMPISRTGTVYADYWIAKYDGNQNLGYTTNPFSEAYLAGTTIATTEEIKHARIYLDDLLWPHQFPVPRFRLKSLWAMEWTSIGATVDTPGVEQATAPTGSTYGGASAGSHSIILPEFGLAAEYAISSNVMARVDVMGFGVPHHSNVSEADAYLSVRRHSLEVVVGGKALHYRTTAQQAEYFRGTVVGGYIELRWHPALFER